MNAYCRSGQKLIYISYLINIFTRLEQYNINALFDGRI